MGGNEVIRYRVERVYCSLALFMKTKYRYTNNKREQSDVFLQKV